MKAHEKIIAGILILMLGVFLLALSASQPCTLSFETHKGQNLNQPYPTYHHCNLGVDQPTQTTDIHGQPLDK